MQVLAVIVSTSIASAVFTVTTSSIHVDLFTDCYYYCLLNLLTMAVPIARGRSFNQMCVCCTYTPVYVAALHK